MMKTHEAKAAVVDLDHLNKLYKTINEKYLTKETIDRETVLDLVKRIAEIDKLYYEYAYPGMKNSKIDQQWLNTGLCHRILSNEIIPEPTTTNTVLTFISGVYAFVDWWYGNEEQMIKPMSDQELFKENNFFCLSPIAVYEFDVKKKNNWFINDGDIYDHIDKFYEITDDQLIPKMKKFKEYRLMNLI